MKLVPTYRLLFFVGLILLPLTLLLVVVASVVVPTIGSGGCHFVVAIMDAYRSRGRLQGIRVMLPEVIRISKDREGNFNLEIENEKLTVRRIRLGLAFPPEIYTPAVELSVELPKDQSGFIYRLAAQGSETGTLPYGLVLSGDGLFMGILVGPLGASNRHGDSGLSQPLRGAQKFKRHFF